MGGRLLCALSLLLAIVVEVRAATREHAEIDGREVWISRPRDQAVRALLIWLPRFDRQAKTDYRWWRSSGLVDQGVVVVVPSHGGLRWDDERERTRLMRLRRHWLAECDLEDDRLLVGGDGDGAQQAQALVLGLPEFFGGALLARGMSDRMPEPSPGVGRPIGIFANRNDPDLPIRALRDTAERIPAVHPVIWQTAMRQTELGPEVWQLARELFAAMGIVLAPPQPVDERADEGDDEVTEGGSEAPMGADAP